MTDRAEGKFTEKYSLADVLDVFDEVRGPVVTTSDIAEHVGCSPELARQKLKTLYEKGEVDRRKTGRIKVWWLTDE